MSIAPSITRSLPDTALQSLEELIHTNTATRGLDKLPPTPDLQNAGASLWQAKRVLLLTGFLIASHRIGETDGPPGALSLAAACDKLGKNVCIVSDKYSLPALQQGLALFHWKQTPKLISLEKGNEEILSYNLLSQFAPDHIVTIERPGQNAQGRYHSMSGVDFTELVPDSDQLLHLARQQGIPVTAIGDGGNEAGMGKIAAYVHEHVPHGETICAAFAADHLIVAGISNWGAASLAAILSLYAGRQLLHTPEKEEELLHTLVDAGLIDGATKRFERTVDGLSLPEYLEVYEGIYRVVEKELKQRTMHNAQMANAYRSKIE